MSHKVIFIDRDGVLNALVKRDGMMVSPRLFQDFRILDGVIDAIQTLRHENYELVVVTNQPDISRGLMIQTELDQMTQAVLNLGVDQVLICPHSDEDACLCRKPKPGLLKHYLETLDSEPTELWIIGDREIDMMAGLEVGAKVIMIGASRLIGISPQPLRAANLLDATKLLGIA
ncbi:MAG: HAD-IIIA family hydrolase [Gammaproteobacteria bacterium]